MEKSLLYIKNNEVDVEVRYVHSIEKKEININKYLNNLCLKYMSTLDGRKKAMRIYWNSNYNVPVYICDCCCLLKIDDVYYINIHNVESIIHNMIIFNSGQTIELKKSERNIKNKVRKLQNILLNIKN